MQKQTVSTVPTGKKFCCDNRVYVKLPEMILDTPDGGGAIFNCMWAQKEAAPYVPPEYRIDFLDPETEVIVC